MIGPPGNDEARSRANDPGLLEDENRENGDSAPALNHVQVERYATLRAELAVRGFTLTLDGSPDAPVYVVARWNRSVDLRDLDHVEAFLHSVGGRP